VLIFSRYLIVFPVYLQQFVDAALNVIVDVNLLVAVVGQCVEIARDCL
jgi:hypothetical protein